MQAITADTVIAYIIHDDRPNRSSSSSRHGAKRRGGLYIITVIKCLIIAFIQIEPGVSLNNKAPVERKYTCRPTNGIGARFYVPLDTKQVISEMFFPANLLAPY